MSEQLLRDIIRGNIYHSTSLTLVEANQSNLGSSKLLGYAAEWATWEALTGQPGFDLGITNDLRISTVYETSNKQAKTKFKAMYDKMTSVANIEAAKVRKDTGLTLGSAKRPDQGTATEKIDVITSDADVHVKFNDAARLAGFQRAKKGVAASKTTVIYDIVMNKFGNTLDIDAGFMDDKGFLRRPAGVKGISKMNSRQKKAATKLKAKFQTARDEYRTAFTNLETNDQHPGYRKEFLSMLDNAGIKDAIIADINEQLLGATGRSAIYFKYFTSGSGVRLETHQYAFENLVVAHNEGQSTKFYKVTNSAGDKTLFYIEFRLDGGGHPPQLKVGPDLVNESGAKMSEKLLRMLIKEEMISLGGKTYQVPASKTDDIIDILSSAGIEEFDPLGAPEQEGFAKEPHWKNWIKSVEGIISEDKLSKLYFKLYELGAASTKTKFLDNVLSMIYDADPQALAKDLFSVGGSSEIVEIPASLLPIAQLNTVSAEGSKANEIGKGELVIPLLFADARGEYGNALYDLQVSGQNWHCKSIKRKNSDVRSSKLLGQKGSKVVRTYGSTKGEFGSNRAEEVALEFATILEMPEGSSVKDILLKFQEVLNDEYREQLSNEAGVIFYVENEKKLYFRQSKDVIVNRVTSNQPSIGMGVDSMGTYANAAAKLNEVLQKKSNFLENQVRLFIYESLLTEELTKTDKKEIEKIARKQFDKQLRAPGFKKEVEKIVSEAIKGEFKGKEHEKAVVAISKKVLRAFHTMMYQKRNIIDTMSV